MLPQLASVLARITQIEDRFGALAPVNAPAATPGGFAQELARATSGQPSLQRVRTAQNMPPRARADFDDLVQAAAGRYGVDPDLVHAVIQAESDYDPSCRSGAGAEGLMQLMPGTARALGVSNPLDPADNISGGVKYLRQQLDRFHDVDLALAAYNAGPGAVTRYDGIPPYRETQAYVRRVLQTLWQRKGQ
jgi:soluble lytic murein transglycosylase-like protein